MTIRLGFAGLGHMGLLHLRNTHFIDDIKVVAVADQSRKGIREAKSHGITEIFEDYHVMFEKIDLDAVIISLPNFLHAPSIMDAAEHGVHVFVEKPLARSGKECAEIQDRVQDNNVVLRIGHNYRYFPHVQRLKAEWDAGHLGDVVIANFEHFVNGPFAHPLEPVPVREWWLDRTKMGGGVLLDQGYHLLDLFRWFFPQPRVVYAQLGYRYNLSLEDSATIILSSELTGTTGIISVGWFQKMVFPDFNFRLNLQGTAKFLSSDHFLPRNLYLHAGKEAVQNALRKLTLRKIRPLSFTYFYPSYYHELVDFIKLITGTTSTTASATVDDGYDTIQLIEQAYHLAENRS